MEARERDRQTDRQADRERDGDREREREKDRERQREAERDRERQIERERLSRVLDHFGIVLPGRTTTLNSKKRNQQSEATLFPQALDPSLAS